MIFIIPCAVFAYLLGSINTAIIVSKKFTGTDIRYAGSGNAGATNTLRTIGKKAAAIVFAVDFLKGLFAVMAAKLLVHFFDAPYICLLIAGFLVQAGHCFPVFFHFKGGKGVATAAGAAVGIMPSVAVLLLIVFAVIALSTKIVSLASGICAVIYPLLAYFLSQSNQKLNFMFAASAAVLIIIMHSQNFARLIDGEEKPVSSK